MGCVADERQPGNDEENTDRSTELLISNDQRPRNIQMTKLGGNRPMPGGIFLESFELREPFRSGQTFIFGITRSFHELRPRFTLPCILDSAAQFSACGSRDPVWSREL